jgi:TniQ
VMTADASPPRPLPIRPRPGTGESPASYLRRLARANHLRPAYLRRYLRQPENPDTIRLDLLAVLAGRSLPALEHALTGRQAGPRQHVRQADKPRLFAAIRRDARSNGLSIRALADRHGVHRRTVRQALASPWPAPRKTPQRRSRLDPFKDAIDAMLSGPGTAEHGPPTVKQIYDRLVSEHEMTRVSYATVRDYVASRGLIRQSPAQLPGGLGHDAREAITHLRVLFESMPPGASARAQPHLDALELIATPAAGVTGPDSNGTFQCAVTWANAGAAQGGSWPKRSCGHSSSRCASR